MAKIKHGFSGQRLIVYPFYVIEQALNNPLVADLVVPSLLQNLKIMYFVPHTSPSLQKTSSLPYH